MARKATGLGRPLRAPKAHLHVWAPHPNPAWSTHVVCSVCSFAALKSLVVKTFSFTREQEQELARETVVDARININPNGR